jgi:hypothetical protein
VFIAIAPYRQFLLLILVYCLCLLQTTVREALVVSATLRLWETRDKALVEAFVDEVLQLVELDSTRDALVRGLKSTGLSMPHAPIIIVDAALGWVRNCTRQGLQLPLHLAKIRSDRHAKSVTQLQQLLTFGNGVPV